jgi:hypothetical protein
MGNRYAKTLQYGKESAHGTHVAATTVFLGDCPWPADITPHKPTYNLVTRVKASESAVLYKQVDSLPIKMEDSYFQGLHLPLALVLKGGVSGSEKTSGQHDYECTYTPGLTAATADTMDSITLELADELRHCEIGYVMGRSVKFTWTFGKDGKLTTELDAFGDYVDDTANMTGALSIPTHTLVNPNLLKFYADTTFAGAGQTLLSGILREVNLEIIGGAHPKPPHGNKQYMDSHGVTYLSWKLGLTLEDNSDATQFRTWFLAQTAVCIRLMQDGPVIGSGSNHSLTFDLWGAPDDATPMGSEADGDHLMPVTMSELYNTTSSSTLACKLVTDKQTV